MAIQVPSFWDYLSQGISQGHQGFLNERQRRRDEDMQNLDILSGLFQAGAIDSSEIQPQVQRVTRRPDLQIAPSAAELRRKIMSGELTPNDEQARFAGTRTTREQLAEQNQITVENIKARHARGEAITPQEAELAGLTDPKQRQADRLTALQPVLTAAAQRYVAQAITHTRGELDASQLAELANQAYQHYLQDSESQMLNLTPEDMALAAPFFHEAVIDAFREQQYRELQKQLRLITASGSRGFNPATMMNALSRTRQLIQSQIEKLFSGGLGSMAAMYIGRDPSLVPDQLKPILQQYEQLKLQLDQWHQVQTGFASGVLPGEAVYNMLQGVSDDLSLSTGIDPSGQPIPSGLGGGMPPRAEVRSMTDNELDIMRRHLRSLNAADKKKLLQQMLDNNEINSADSRRLGYDPRN